MSKSTYTYVRPNLKVRAEKKHSKIQDINNAELSSTMEADKSQGYNDPKMSQQLQSTLCKTRSANAEQPC
ncbi:hypothetical protein G6F42_027147 [Rhizopus arrhizus]|nr:hypothetical protein G6F42_027147 [Rhizopus arrhizus]